MKMYIRLWHMWQRRSARSIDGWSRLKCALNLVCISAIDIISSHMSKKGVCHHVQRFAAVDWVDMIPKQFPIVHSMTQTPRSSTEFQRFRHVSSPHPTCPQLLDDGLLLEVDKSVDFKCMGSWVLVGSRGRDAGQYNRFRGWAISQIDRGSVVTSPMKITSCQSTSTSINRRTQGWKFPPCFTLAVRQLYKTFSCLQMRYAWIFPCA